MDITYYELPLTTLLISVVGIILVLYILFKLFDSFLSRHSRSRQIKKINQSSLGKVDRLKVYEVLDDHRKRLNHNMIKVIFYISIAIFFNLGLLVNPQLESLYDTLYFAVSRLFVIVCYLLAILNIIIEVLPNLSVLRKAEKRNTIAEEQLNNYDKKTFGITMDEVKKLRDVN